MERIYLNSVFQIYKRNVCQIMYPWYLHAYSTIKDTEITINWKIHLQTRPIIVLDTMKVLLGTLVRIWTISLGYNCHVKVFIDRIGESEKKDYLHQPFDWISSPMWSIYEVVKSDFSGFTERALLSPRKRFADKPDEYITHKTYNLCFIHEFGKDVRNIPESKWTEVLDKYTRRIERWNTTLKKGVPLFFIRLEPDTSNRIAYPEFERPGNEKYYIEQFADLMKSKGVECTILFLSTSFPKGYDKDRRICTVQFTKKCPTDIIGADQIQQILRMNGDFIRSCMRT